MKEGHQRNGNLKRAHRQLVCLRLTIYLTTEGVREVLDMWEDPARGKVHNPRKTMSRKGCSMRLS